MRRVLFKVSGEMLAGEAQSGLDPTTLARLAAECVALRDEGVELALVVGGGNLFRGIAGAASGMDRSRADQMGMLATTINALALADALRRAGGRARVLSAFELPRMVELFNAEAARAYLADGEILIFSGGTGNPYFTTDSAAALRAAEIGAGLLLKGTKVDGVYSADPLKHPEAERFNHLSYQDCLSRQLRVMDQAAFSLCAESGVQIRVFQMAPGQLRRAVEGEIGTLIG
ncbi:UMP kinase [Myxococcota bacterium]|nr:UMP kinase [Myxococcota bacterium]MBU1429953.1 UMP kinase [Myxococcota bacterium]MBU1898030.1 UMP kinase [Myxococcota bacterium]